jgi:hypothetical protein
MRRFNPENPQEFASVFSVSSVVELTRTHSWQGRVDDPAHLFEQLVAAGVQDRQISGIVSA